MNRKCANWLKTYKDYVLPRIAAPESYVFWSGLFCLAAAIRRKVCISDDLLGTWRCYPHLYILLVGPPGFRKNTAMGPAIDLLNELADSSVIRRAPSLITKESLVDGIFKSSDSAIYLTVEEFGDLFLKSGPEMYELLTSLFDAKKHLEQGTMSRAYEFAANPCLDVLAGTTPQWIADKMPESVIGGGLASRILFVYEDKEPGSRIFFKRKNLPVNNFEQLRQDLIEDLQHIALNIEGNFDVDDDVIEWMEEWNRKKGKITNPKLQGYAARKITMILKLAQLFSLSYKDELKLTKVDIEAGINFVESLEVNLPKVFAGVGKNVYNLDVRDMREFISKNPGVRKSELYREFQNVALVDQIEKMVNGLVIMKIVDAKYDEDVKELVFTLIEE